MGEGLSFLMRDSEFELLLAGRWHFDHRHLGFNSQAVCALVLEK